MIQDVLLLTSLIPDMGLWLGLDCLLLSGLSLCRDLQTWWELFHPPLILHPSHQVHEENAWLWWLVLGFGFLICIRACVQVYLDVLVTGNDFGPL